MDMWKVRVEGAIQTPVWNNMTKKCEECNKNAPFWNETRKLCEECKKDTPSWNNFTKKC